MIGIYKITNLINGKIYIGKSTDIDRRWKEHIRNSKYPYKNRSSNFYRDINQLGVNNFNIEVLEECLESVLNDREIFYIEKYKVNGRIQSVKRRKICAFPLNLLLRV